MAPKIGSRHVEFTSSYNPLAAPRDKSRFKHKDSMGKFQEAALRGTGRCSMYTVSPLQWKNPE
jgi:hypothetical protein